MHVPDSPTDFFESFFPAQFRLHRDHFPRTAHTPAATFVVRDVGAWSIRIAADELHVMQGLSRDTKMQVVFDRDDFEAVVMRRAKNEMAQAGRVSKASLGPFVLLLSLQEKLDLLDSMRDSLLFLVQHEGQKHKMMIVPGADEPPARARAVLQLNLQDTLALLNREANGLALFMSRRLKVSGDLSYALKANALLA